MASTYQLGDWRVAEQRNEISRGGETQRLEHKAMQVLLYLLRNADRPVPAKELLEQVWSDRVVEENSVHRAISQLRRALGDSTQQPRYISNVRGRGYLLVAAVQLLDEAERVEPESLPEWQPAQLDHPLSRLTHYLLAGNDKLGYLVLALIGVVPIISAPSIGIWDDRVVGSEALLLYACELPSELHQTIGFGQRWNWLMYPVVLPLWLLMARLLFRRAFGFAADSPLRTEPSYAPLLLRFQSVFVDWRPFVYVLAANVLITAVDQSDVTMRFINVESVCPTNTMDWGWYFLLFEDVSKLDVVLFSLWTTGEQMIFTQFGLLTATYVLLFNRTYMQSIYLRGDPARQHMSYVLDFEDPDRRFGLRKLSSIFDWQIAFCVLGGVVLLISRYFNTRLEIVDKLANDAVCAVGIPLAACATKANFFFGDVRWLIQDSAQMLIVVLWLLFFLTVLWIANVKLLPRRVMGENQGRSAYLSAFQPGEDSLEGERLEQVAAKFRNHDFWPTGDGRAADALWLSILIAALMFFPLLPVSSAQIILIGVFLIVTRVLSKLFFGMQSHLLRRVDSSLVRRR